MKTLTRMLLVAWLVLCSLPIGGWFLYELIHVLEGQEVGIMQVSCLAISLLFGWVFYHILMLVIHED